MASAGEAESVIRRLEGESFASRGEAESVFGGREGERMASAGEAESVIGASDGELIASMIQGESEIGRSEGGGLAVCDSVEVGSGVAETARVGFGAQQSEHSPQTIPDPEKTTESGTDFSKQTRLSAVTMIFAANPAKYGPSPVKQFDPNVIFELDAM
jgi:hypothetical protein